MKKMKITCAFIAMMICQIFTSFSFADMNPLIFPETCSIIGYDAKIVGANLFNNDSTEEITIITTGTETNQSSIKKAAIKFTDKDLSLGVILANSVGKNIQIFFHRVYLPGGLIQCKVRSISVISDGYWNLP